ncbi:protein MpOMT11 [Marchantia polymorpha subsp. ruderalis]
MSPVLKMSPQNLGDDEAGRLKALQIAMMLALPFSLKAAVNLGVPKILVDAGSGAELTAEDIATSITKLSDRCADATNLERILRVLASHNVVTEIVSKNGNDSDCSHRSYGPTSTLKYFTDNEDGVSLAPFLLMATDPVTLPAFQYLHLPVLDVNVEPHVLVHGMKLFEYAATDARFSKLFNKAMHDHTHIEMSALLKKYRGFETLTSLVDVGGGLGATLAMILPKYPKIRGINFDQPHVVADGLQVPNLEHVGGDFFASVPEADAVFMKWILHDWDDERCGKILKNVWRALPPHGKLINLDYVLSDTSDPSPATKISLCTDISMMAVNSNGRERTLAQFKTLAADAGFKRVECVAQTDNLSLLEFYKN